VTEELLRAVLELQQRLGVMEGRIARLEGMVEVLLAVTLATLAAVLGPTLARALANRRQKARK